VGAEKKASPESNAGGARIRGKRPFPTGRVTLKKYAPGESASFWPGSKGGGGVTKAGGTGFITGKRK